MSFELDESQLRVAEAPAYARQLVIAGAGRGKTEVVAARVQYLTEVEGLSAADEILVLTFSRAAVAAVERRFGLKGRPPVRVSTFDSFASQTLLEAGEDPAEHYGFDARIRAASKIFQGTAALDSVELLRHLILDEVQDLVGDRARLSLDLISALDAGCGLTALGDPLQGIYDWQLDASAENEDLFPERVFAAMIEDHGAIETHLEHDYRARGGVPKAVVRLGDQLRTNYPDRGNVARSEVREMYNDLVDLGPVTENADLIGDGTGTTAVLCRRNGDALAVSLVLRDFAVEHVLRRPLEDVGVAAWVTWALARAQAATLTEPEIRELLAAQDQVSDVDDAWVALKTAENDLQAWTQLSLAKLRSSLRNRAVPMTLLAVDDAPVVVSTVHRAKGLEFDRVVVVDETWSPPDQDDWSEARVGYVALSRARDEVFRCQAPGNARSIRKHRRSRRFCRFTRTNWAWAMEVSSSDTSDVWLSTDGDAVASQKALESDALGRPVLGRLVNPDEPGSPVYDLLLEHSGSRVGRTSESFGRALVKTFGQPHGKPWPNRLDGMVVSSLETVAGDASQTRAASLGDHGLWVVPRLGGFARPDFRGDRT